MALSTRFGRPRSMRWVPGASYGDLFQEFDQLLRPLADVSRGNIGLDQAMDLYETDDAVVVQMAVPGVRADDLDLSIEGRQVTIRGSLRDEDTEGRRYWIRSMPRGDFGRTVTVPSGIDADAIEASVEQGVLTLTMPKAPEAIARKIAVNSNGRSENVPTLDTEQADA